VVRAVALPALASLFVLAGAALLATPAGSAWSFRTWYAGLLITGSPVLWRTLRHVVRGHLATDVVAMLAIVVAAILQEPLAGLIVVLMQTGGEALERYAEGRASRAVRRLEEEAPRIAHRMGASGIRDVAVDDVAIGDALLIRPGEMVPCDGVVMDGVSQVDSSRLTGEVLPVNARAGTLLMSGTLNLTGPLTLRATALTRESQYARIVELVRSAAASKAPLQRLADRYAVWFTPVTLVVCAISWIASGDATTALAVLVVATPCPLILATPIAIIGGVNRAATRHIIMRTGGALERLSAARVAVFDKTGTLTQGGAAVSGVTPANGQSPHSLLRLAAALEQYSGHALARSVVEAARDTALELPPATDVVEDAGRGVSGRVEGSAVAVGGHDYIGEFVVRDGMRGTAAPVSGEDSTLRAHVAVDGRLAGTIEFAERVRPGARQMVEELRALGIRRVLLLSGDRERNTRDVASAVGADAWEGSLLPTEKLERIDALSRAEGPVLMVGDGTNDAPALSRADVGVALAGHGGGVTAEAADVVILTDELSRVSEAVEISRRTMRIARQSIRVGLTLSGIAMLVAAVGRIPPVIGALLQEAIDIAVIVNALRASLPSARPVERETLSAASSRPLHDRGSDPTLHALRESHTKGAQIASIS
jgi:heavy metal translocating P-type ATPase